jgi:hypothetical protein
MSIFHWLFRRKKPPNVYLGDVQMHLDWNVVSAFCEIFGASIGHQPTPEELRLYYSAALNLPLYHSEGREAAGGHLLHLAITDLRHGYFGALDTKDY